MNFKKCKKILLITHNDLSIQAGDVTLICRRAEAMFELYGIRTDCIIRKKFPKPSHNIPGVNFDVIDDKKIINKVNEYKPTMVIIYGILSYHIINLLNKIKYNGKIYLDIQGVPEELIDFEKGINKLLHFPKYFIKKQILKKYLSKSDGAFVVTDEMQKYCENLVNQKYNLDYIKIRCGLSNILLNNEQLLNRQKIRKKLNIGDKNVYVFSGYRKPWQKMESIIEIFKIIDSLDKDAFFCFFCNTDKQFEQTVYSIFPKKNYIIKFLNFDEYFIYLSACDVGFLYRDYLTTNRVAFPNKFSDYLSSGLLISMNDAVVEPFNIAATNNINIINCNDFFDVNKWDLIYEQIKNRKNNIQNFYKKCFSVCQNELTYKGQLLKLDEKESK